VEAAASSSWVTYLGTVDARGRPHVSVVAPGFTEGSIWFATRQSSKKFRNLSVDASAAFHWPVGNQQAPGELVARGTARTYTSASDRRRLWEAGVLSYDPAGFFGSPDNEDLAFVEVVVASARLLGPDFVAHRYTPTLRGHESGEASNAGL
jgi:general stress protein 26